MRAIRFVTAVFVMAMVTAPISGATSVPFKGSWSGVTTSATFENFPPVVTIIAEGSGQLTHLGRYSMASPHTTDVFTGETIGDQIFTAANGDMLTAYCAGFPLPQPDMTVVGSLDCEITGGTGRFEGATGSYVFFLTAVPRTDGGPGYATEAQISGQISF
jgi:hypothetical protein